MERQAQVEQASATPENRVTETIAGIVAVTLTKGIFSLVRIVPHGVRITVMAAIFRAGFVFVPRLRRTIATNLKLAFPEKDDCWRRNLVKSNSREIARLLSDAIRLSELDAKWVSEHVACPALDRYSEVLSRGTGILIATGHLGSFELLGHTIGLMGHPLAAIARNFKNPSMDKWWKGLREARGNRIIDRTGAFKETLREIEAGRSVAILFDQNVTKNHAVFVNLFGVPAATTKSVALAAIKTRAPVFVASMRYVENDRYCIDAVECDFSGIIDDESKSSDAKVSEITQVITCHFEAMIKNFPQGWFWLHRRWKTRPDDDSNKVY